MALLGSTIARTNTHLSMKRLLIISLFVVVFSPSTAATADGSTPGQKAVGGIRALLVVAHPDDEYEMAGTVYRLAKELSATVDQLIVTDGEAGYRYSSLAEQYYGVDLTNETAGRTRLPEIRREEARHAARILGIKHQWFLNQKDEHFTLDADEVLKKSWNKEVVKQAIYERLRKGRYDFMIVLLPASDTHGEHKAASILAVAAAEQIPSAQRPVILGALAGGDGTVPYSTLPGYASTATRSPQPSFRFDRDIHFGYRDSLTYQIVVDWVIAEHKSQGLFQTRCRQDRFENFWVFSASGDSATAETESLFAAVSGRESTDRPQVAGAAKR
jgi:LmbE family N-acetylglucosaminyl deacetylase